MAMPTVLIVDNNENLLEDYTNFLRKRGYNVIPAASCGEAKRILAAGGVDVAVFDLRLNDDQDEQDVSGLILAREVAPGVPKIILTGFPEVRHVCAALRPGPGGLPAAFHFVEKELDLEQLVEAIDHTLTRAKKVLHARREVFVVHGHDEAARLMVADFIRKVGLKPIILCEEPGEGLPILQQIERHSEVGFVVVLLTGDDVGYAKNDPESKRPRARQNVIFELGFFIAKLGSRKVRCLYQEGVEIPTDYQGIIYIPQDEGGGWRLRLAREMKAAGVPVDLARLL